MYLKVKFISYAMLFSIFALTAFCVTSFGQNCIGHLAVLVWQLDRVLPPDDHRLLHHQNGDSQTVRGVKFSSDGRWLFTCGSDGLKQWDAKSHKLVHEQAFDFPNAGHPVAVYCIAVSHTEPLVYMGSVSPSVKVWNYETKKIVGSIPTRLGENGTITAIATSSDGNTLAVAESSFLLKGEGQPKKDDFTILLWDLENSRVRGRMAGHLRPLQCLEFLGDDQVLLANTETYWVAYDVEQQKLIDHFGTRLHLVKRHGQVAEPRQKLAYFRSPLQYSFEKPAKSFPAGTTPLASKLQKKGYLKQGDYFVSVDTLYSGASGRPLRTFQQFGNGKKTIAVAVSPDGKVLVTGGNGFAMRGGFGAGDDQRDRNLSWWKLSD